MQVGEMIGDGLIARKSSLAASKRMASRTLKAESWLTRRRKLAVGPEREGFAAISGHKRAFSVYRRPG